MAEQNAVMSPAMISKARKDAKGRAAPLKAGRASYV